jgi:2',3'-cyclic-nucleotide 2'-phosphodiesterase (5'-nucleotidase family)
MLYPNFKKNIAILFFIAFIVSCKTAQIVPLKVSFDSYKINTQPSVDSSYSLMLAVYKDSLNKTMNDVIGFSVNGLTKKQPESILGNFMTDAFKTMAEKKFNKKINAAFVNFGGIRSYLPKGDITVGKIFELMPFDNLVVLQEVTGKQLKDFLARVCEKGGWPVSNGLTYSIKDKKLADVLIDEKTVEDTAVYTIANSDYIANGGDNCDMLKLLPKQNINYLMRDALIEYVKLQTQASKSIDAKIENRVVYAK